MGNWDGEWCSCPREEASGVGYPLLFQTLRVRSWPGNIDDLLKALLAASPGSVATVADAVVEPDGMSIGGMLSASTVAVRLAAEESEAFTFPSHVGWLRKDDCLRSWLAPVCW